MRQRRVAIVGCVGVPARYGGFETLAENLLETQEFEFTVYCSSLAYKEKVRQFRGARLRYLALNANGVQSILYDAISAFSAALSRNDVILVLGVSAAFIFPMLRLLFPGIRLVTNVDGVEWRREKWRGIAKRFLRFSEKMAAKWSNIVIADNQAIAFHLKTEYGVASRVIAYGGDHAAVETKAPAVVEGYALMICRVEPENNVHIILEAFAALDTELIAVGNWSANVYGRRLRYQYAGHNGLKLVDPIYDADELAEYRRKCRIYIHGHSAGGTNPSLVEIMHFAKPVIAFDCAYNRETTENRAMYFSDVDTLVHLLRRSSSDLMNEVGRAMLEIANRRYTWDIVRAQYFQLFRSA